MLRIHIDEFAIIFNKLWQIIMNEFSKNRIVRQELQLKRLAGKKKSSNSQRVGAVQGSH